MSTEASSAGYMPYGALLHLLGALPGGRIRSG